MSAPLGGASLLVVGRSSAEFLVLGVPLVFGVTPFFLLGFLVEDSDEVSFHEGSVSAVELPRPLRRGLLGVRFFPFFRFQLVEHALGAKEELFEASLFLRPPSAHRLVVVLANVGEDAAIGCSKARGNPPSCPYAVFGPCPWAYVVHLL